ncbi:unnamed protein product [Cuscuta europaea]|uniref:Uncharacterized protein n=1 Tax=Cuscuta europaea TaxID=41803 RepID=A0A9P0Z0L7_CUSEU|nr:unnamed protein product [Cuscuta europaea]
MVLGWGVFREWGVQMGEGSGSGMCMGEALMVAGIAVVKIIVCHCRDVTAVVGGGDVTVTTDWGADVIAGMSLRRCHYSRLRFSGGGDHRWEEVVDVTVYLSL